MELNAGGGGATGRRQAFREYCASHGLVYSRMRLYKYASVAAKDNFKSMADKVWLSKDSKIELRQMTASVLHVDRVNEEVEDAGLYRFNTARDSPFDYAAHVADSDLSTHTNWTHIDSDDKADGIFIDINAASLSNKYYLVRGEVEEDTVAGVANTTSIDTFNGPLLNVDDLSGDKTAEWYHDDDILFQIKIDKVQSKLRSTGRKPASN